MPRSTLLQAFRRLASDHAAAQARGVSPEQIRDERRAARIGRRSVLAWAGAAGLAAAASRPRVAFAAGKAPRIAIIGGGISGMSAALALADAGYASTVYEASSRIGGRMHSNTTSWVQGQTSEWCGELIDTDHTTILGLAQRFDLTVVDLIAAQPAGSEDTLYFFDKYYANAQADKDFKPVHKTLKEQLKAAPFPTTYNSYTAAGQQLDETSVYDWIEQFVPGGHSTPLGQYLDTAYNQEYGLDTDQQSSLNIVYELGYQPKGGGLSIYGQSDQRFHIVGGNEQLPNAIAASLPGPVKTGWRMTAIALNHDGSYTLTFSTAGGTKTVVADRVVMTIPFGVLRGLDTSKAGFDPLKLTAINELGYGTNSKLVLQFTQRYWDGSGPWGIGDGNIYTDLFFQNTWDSSRGIPGAAGVLVAYTGGSNGLSYNDVRTPYASADSSKAVADYAKQFLAELENPWPGVSQYWNGRATLSTPWQDPNLLGSYSCWKVGQYTLFSGYEGVRQGKCHFAGEHTSQSFQGFMEGAAEEGQRAAGEILSDYAAGVFP